MPASDDHQACTDDDPGTGGDHEHPPGAPEPPALCGGGEPKERGGGENTFGTGHSEHNLLVDLSRFGHKNPNHIFVPTDEPHGTIEATVRRG